MRSDVNKEYFTWLCDVVTRDRFSEQVSCNKLLSYLYDTRFRYSIKMDKNRADDGVDLRRRFSIEADRYLRRPCSVLEMMVALAIRCETIMDDPAYGDRTAQWFWLMISNLGLGGMMDDIFDEEYVEEVIERFLNRDYDPDGRGGLFVVRNCEEDLRDVEIWVQLCWYLNCIT